jgi:hypothetical protein
MVSFKSFGSGYHIKPFVSHAFKTNDICTKYTLCGLCHDVLFLLDETNINFIMNISRQYA